MKNYFKLILLLTYVILQSQDGLFLLKNKQSDIRNKNLDKIEINTIAFSDSVLTPFQKSLLLIQNIELPIDFICGIDNYQFIDNCPDMLKSIFPKNERINGIIGKLPPYKDKELLLFCSVGDIIYPYLYIYSKDGIILDSLYLHLGYCSADGHDRNISRTIINNDYSINMYDTTEYYHYKLKVREIDSLLITHRNYHINSIYKFQSSFEKKQFIIK